MCDLFATIGKLFKIVGSDEIARVPGVSDPNAHALNWIASATMPKKLRTVFKVGK